MPSKSIAATTPDSIKDMQHNDCLMMCQSLKIWSAQATRLLGAPDFLGAAKPKCNNTIGMRAATGGKKIRIQKDERKAIQ
jgi:hypothetical protein